MVWSGTFAVLSSWHELSAAWSMLPVSQHSARMLIFSASHLSHLVDVQGGAVPARKKSNSEPFVYVWGLSWEWNKSASVIWICGFGSGILLPWCGAEVGVLLCCFCFFLGCCALNSTHGRMTAHAFCEGRRKTVPCGIAAD
jgi:hypothetical protein